MSGLALRVPPLVHLALCAGAMKAVAVLAPGAALAIPAADTLASACGLLGAACAVGGVLSFARAGTTVNPHTPERASALVARGLYRVTRNPMYLGMLLLLVGWGLKLGNGLALPLPALFVLAMNRLQIEPEEAALRARFGADYDDYSARVRRWL